MSVSCVITLFLLLSGATQDEYILSRAIQGEAGMFKSQPDTLDRVGMVALNRYDAGWCDSIEDCILDGFWGVNNVRIPSQYALESAQRVINGEVSETKDMFVFSAQDCETLDLDMNLATHVAEKGGWMLVFFKNNITLKENLP